MLYEAAVVTDSRMLSLLRRAAVVAALTMTASAFAGPISQDEQEAAAPPHPVGDAASAIPGADVLETGDAGKLAKLVDQMTARGRAASAPSRALPLGAREKRIGNADGDSQEDAGGSRDAPRRPAWLGGESDSSTNNSGTTVMQERDPSADRPRPSVLDSVDREERGRIRDVVYLVKEVVYHPLTWVVVIVLVGVSLLSTGRRR